MSRKRPTLQEVQRLYPSDMSRCAGYVWHLGTRIGKGSFGEVYLGWTSVSRLAYTTFLERGCGRGGVCTCLKCYCVMGFCVST